MFLTYREFGDALEPALGSLPRPGTRQAEGGGSFQPWPGDGSPFSWVRQFFFELFLSRVDRLDGTTESWEIFTAPWNAVTRSGEHLEANWVPRFERLDEPFEVAEGVVIPPGEYQFTRWRVEAQSSRSHPWEVRSTVCFGDFFDGSLTRPRPQLPPALDDPARPGPLPGLEPQLAAHPRTVLPAGAGLGPDRGEAPLDNGLVVSLLAQSVAQHSPSSLSRTCPWVPVHVVDYPTFE